MKLKIRKLFDEHLDLPFPQEAPTEELRDMKGELALYGGHVAGLVSSYLQNAPVNQDFVKVNLELEKRMQNFHPKTPQEKKSIQELMSYKHILDKLITTLSKLLTES